jgi:hypothetical protein
MKEKKKWSKPECEKVNLAPNEAVLTGCKTPTTPVTTKNALTCANSGCKSNKVS